MHQTNNVRYCWVYLSLGMFCYSGVRHLYWIYCTLTGSETCSLTCIFCVQGFILLQDNDHTFQSLERTTWSPKKARECWLSVHRCLTTTQLNIYGGHLKTENAKWAGITRVSRFSMSLLLRWTVGMLRYWEINVEDELLTQTDELIFPEWY